MQQQPEIASLSIQENALQAYGSAKPEDTVFYTPMLFMVGDGKPTPDDIKHQNDLRRDEGMRRLVFTTPPMRTDLHLAENEDVAMLLKPLNDEGETTGDPEFYAVLRNEEENKHESKRDITEAFYTRCHEKGITTHEREGPGAKEAPESGGGSPEIK